MSESKPLKGGRVVRDDLAHRSGRLTAIGSGWPRFLNDNKNFVAAGAAYVVLPIEDLAQLARQNPLNWPLHGSRYPRKWLLPSTRRPIGDTVVDMAATLDNEVRVHLFDALDAGNLDAFEAWFVSETWDAPRTRLVSSIDHAFGERECMTEADLRAALADAASRVEIGWWLQQSITAAASTTQEIIRDVRVLLTGNTTVTISRQGTTPHPSR